MNWKKLISSGNIIIKEYKEDAETGCYLGNGRFGAVMSGLGLNMSPDMQKKYPQTGQSQYMHMNHWGRFRFFSEAMKKKTSADYILPLFKIYWEREPKKIINYRQCQNFYNGTLETKFTTDEGQRIQVLTWFDMVNKNLAGIQLEVSEGIMPIKVSAVTDFIPYAFLLKKMTHQTVRVKQDKDGVRIIITCEDTWNYKSSIIYFYSNAPVEMCEDGLCFLISKGHNEIFISYGGPVEKAEVSHSLDRTRKNWKEMWKKSAWFDFPDDSAQKTWIRSLAYLISSYDDALDMIQPTNGLTGNMFPFHFVQDMEYIAPALMMSGHTDIVKHWIEKFAGEIEDMKLYAKALWPETEGIYPPWELPYGEMKGYHSPCVPVIYCYEPHNAGYLCRMAKEAADFVNDQTWTEQYAYPLIREICKFYLAACKKEADGKWHLKWYPCIGQDEAGGRNKYDYLCSLYSAKYSFQTAVAYGIDINGEYTTILEDGLAFENLISKYGIYSTYQGADNFGVQKHPIQLDGISYFPIEKEPSPLERKAYELRHDIIDKGGASFYYGWTLGQFLLSGTNIRDVKGWKSDWLEMRASNYTDSKWVQIYETSGQAEKSFYITSHGMILQSLIRNYVNDYWGCLNLAACPVFEGEVSFGNVKTRLGIVVSGTIKNKKIYAELEAKRDCTFEVNGVSLQMKQGERKIVEISG